MELVALAVLPASPFRPTDSRSDIELSYDASALSEANKARGNKLPLDIEHVTERGAGDARATAFEDGVRP